MTDKRSMITAGLIPDTEPYSQQQVRDAYDRADTSRATHRVEFKLDELFTAEELQHPDKCELELVTQLVTENTNGHLATRALLIVKKRPPTDTPPKDGPLR